MWRSPNYSFPHQNLSMKKPHHTSKVMGDVFYGNNDCAEMNECIYNEDVLKSMRRAQELKALKKKKKEKKKSYWRFFECFRSLWFVLGGGTEFYDDD
jgi:hypothetical protein